MAKYRERVKRIVDATCLTFPCTFDNAGGELMEALPGDWLVTEENGAQCIMDACEFEATFEPITPRGPKAKTLTVLDCEA